MTIYLFLIWVTISQWPTLSFTREMLQFWPKIPLYSRQGIILTKIVYCYQATKNLYFLGQILPTIISLTINKLLFKPKSILQSNNVIWYQCLTKRVLSNKTTVQTRQTEEKWVRNEFEDATDWANLSAGLDLFCYYAIASLQGALNTRLLWYFFLTFESRIWLHVLVLEVVNHSYEKWRMSFTGVVFYCTGSKQDVSFE